MNIKTTGLAVLAAMGMIASATAAAPAVDAEFREKLHWQPAVTVTIAVDRSHLLSGPSLEKIVAQAQKPPAKTAEQSVKKSQVVVQSELIPLRYRHTINRYFLLIRRGSRRMGLQTRPIDAKDESPAPSH